MPTVTAPRCTAPNPYDVRFSPNPIKAMQAYRQSAGLAWGMSLNPFTANFTGMVAAYTSQFEPGPCHPMNMPRL